MEIEVTDDIRVAPESKNMIRILSEAFEKRTPTDINGKQYMVVAKNNSVFSMRRVESVKAAEWAGEGLPPVGTVLEIRAHALNGWHEAEIKFASRNVIVWDWVGEPSINGLCTAYAHAIEIRPIRTPEQIAAEERQRDISEIHCELVGMAMADEDAPKGTNDDWYRVAEFMHGKGYRKQVKP